MYLKLNFTNNVAWKDVFNMLRIILTYNIQSISDLRSNSEFGNDTIIDSTTKSYLDANNSEIYRSISPGVGYGTSNILWSYNWAGSTNPAVYTTYGNGPEIVIQRNVSTYQPTSQSDSTGKYWVRFRWDGASFSLGTFQYQAGLTTASVSGTAATSPTLSTGEDRIQGYNMSTITSFFLYMTPTSILVGGRGPVGPNSVGQGWLTTTNRRITNIFLSASVTHTLSTYGSVIAEGSRISFATATGGSASAQFPSGTNLANNGSYYYVRTTGAGGNFSFANSLYNLHTGSYISPAVAGINDILVDGYIPHNPTNNNYTQAHFGPAFVTEFTPYDSTAITSNKYLPVIYSGGIYANWYNNSSSTAIHYNPRAWYGISSQDFLWADAFYVKEAYRLLSIQVPTPTLINFWSTSTSVPVYIGTDLRTIERAPLGDQNTATGTTDRSIGAALSDQPGYKFPDANGNPSYGLFPLTWSNSSLNTAGGKLSPNLAGFMLFNGDYSPDDYFSYSNTTYALWPMADGFTRRLGLAVPKT